MPSPLLGDQLKVVASADGTVVTLDRRDDAGVETSEQWDLNQGEFFTRDVISGSTYRVTSNNKIFVAQVWRTVRPMVQSGVLNMMPNNII